jgi:hypothetical protein
MIKHLQCLQCSFVCSDRTVFVAVPRPGMKFTIKLWADSATRKAYRVRVYIDGTWDHASYTLTDAHSTRIEYFIDENNKKKYNFIFASSMWSDDESRINIKENNRFGSIIVEFYEAVWTLKELNENPTYTVVTESNVSNDLPYHTQFEEAPLTEEETPIVRRVKDCNDVENSSYYGWKSADQPSAVLKMHYRPKMWLKLRGLTPDPFYARLSPRLSSESENDDDDDDVRESRNEFERIREKLRKLRRARNYLLDDDDDDSNGKKRRKKERQIAPQKDRNPKYADNNKTPESNRSTDNRSATNNYNNRSTETCNGKKVDISSKSRSASSTPKVKFTRYFEEIIEEAKYIDIEVSSNKPTEETIQNKKIREIIEILDSDDEV